MFITPAYAQAAGASGGDLFGLLVPPLVILGIFYLLIIRPQQQRDKERRARIEAVRRGDQVILAGGITGKVVKAKEGEPEVDVEIAKDTVVKVLRVGISDIRGKTEPEKQGA